MPPSMCFLVTFAVPHDRRPARQLLPWAEHGLVVKAFAGRGSGHAYASGLSVYSVTDGQCSCSLYSAREQSLSASVRACLATCADRYGAAEFIVHCHRGRFDSEKFAVTDQTITGDRLVAEDTTTPCDVRFRVERGRAVT